MMIDIMLKNGLGLSKIISFSTWNDLSKLLHRYKLINK